MAAPPESLQVLAECPDCGLFQTLPAVAPGDAAHCDRCDATMRRGRASGQITALVCTLTAAVLFIMALSLPFLDLRSVGRFYQATLFTGPHQLQRLGTWEIGAVVLVTLVAMPAIHLGLLLVVLLGMRLARPPWYLPHLFGWVERVRPWSMIEVFLLGVFVAYTRLKVIAEVDVGPALIALGAMVLCIVAADAELDHDAMWETMAGRGLLAKFTDAPELPRIGCDCCRLVLRAKLGSRCPRCWHHLRHRKPHSLARSWALLIAAAMLYLPANIYPVMTVIRFGQGEPNTILSGVKELIDLRMWPLALIVLIASVLVPVIKLIVLSTLLVMTRRGSSARLGERSRAYRIIEAIGRWSMIDVFMLTVLVALVRMGFIATVLPGVGMVAFAAVVVLTMFASAAFDPRIMWDAAATQAASPMPQPRAMPA